MNLPECLPFTNYLTLPYLTSCNTALYVNKISKFDNMKTQNMMHHEMLGQYFINFFVSALPNGHIIVFFIYLIQQYVKSAFHDERSLVL